MRAATHDRDLRRVQWAAAIAPLVLGAILACAVLGVGCATVTDPPPDWPPSPSCAADPSGPTCPPPIGDRRAGDAGR